jgi:tRNA(adenine34) deaminase
MNLAFQEARAALDEDEVPVGAVIVKDGLLLGRGHNRTRSLQDPTAHAEIIAITAACQSLTSERLDDCDIYTTLEPCPMCAGALVLGRVKRLYFAADDPRMGASGSLIDVVRDGRMGHTLEVYRLGREQEAVALLQEFYKRRRRDE